jgi:hypothetical protein
MYELARIERVLLAAIGHEGLPFSAIRNLTGPNLSVLNRLCDSGYVRVCEPEDGPYYYLSAVGSRRAQRQLGCCLEG